MNRHRMRLGIAALLVVVGAYAGEAPPETEEPVARSGLPAWIIGWLANDGGGNAETPPEEPETPETPPPPPNQGTGLGEVGTLREERLRLFEAVGQDVFAPYYADFIDTTAALADTVEGYCDAPSGDVADVAAAWRAAMSAWQHAQFLAVGPVEEDNRRFRIQLFPDANDAVQRGVATLLGGSEAITEAVVQSSSVGAQGLPALEYLIYGDAAPLTDAASAPRRCALAVAIARNLRTIAAEIGAPWAAGGQMRADFASASGFFLDDDDALVAVLEAIAVQAEFIADRKLGRPWMLRNAAGLESHLAAHSKENVQANTAALAALFDAGGDDYRVRDYLRRAHDDESIGQQMADALDDAQQRLATLAGLEDILNGAESGDVDGLEDAYQRMADLALDAAVAAGVELGFNSQDGD